MTVTITGATGFIGRRLMTALLGEGHSVRALSRRAGAAVHPNARLFVWDPMTEAPPREALEGADARGSPGRRAGGASAGPPRRRGASARAVWAARAAWWKRSRRWPGGRRSWSAPPPPASTARAAARRLTESSPPGSGFLAEVVQGLGTRGGRRRIARHARGQVPHRHRARGARRRARPHAAASSALAWAERWVGASSGCPGSTWTTLPRSFVSRSSAPFRGVLNAVAPNPVTNADFTRTLAAVLRRPALFPAPPFALRLAFGEMSQVLLDSQRVFPEAARAAGFGFSYPELRPALNNILKAS